MSDLAARFMALFDGLERSYGVFDVNGSRERDGKKTGKVTSLQNKVTEDVWRSHLKGKQSIGIVPIKDDSTCYFGAIDIDVYLEDTLKKTAKKIQELKLPLIPCRTKSGGVHCWLFLTEAAPAALVQRKLREMASALGHGRSEIFPKQTEVLPDRGDIGSWINMPYFNGVEGGRYAVRPGGETMPIEEFVQTAELLRVTPKELADLANEKKSSDLGDGPPCLQHLISQGFPAGTRNSGLYNLGVYAKKAHPDAWEPLVEQYNIKWMMPPLGSTEVKDVVKSLKKKDYQYTCTQNPIVNFCNSAVCRGRKYGVGDHAGMPVITGLTKFNSAPPIWFADIEGGGRLELETPELQSQFHFQRRCMESLNCMPPVMNAKAWQAMVQSLLEDVTVIDAPVDATQKGQLSEMVEKYCTQRAQAMAKDEIRLGKPFTDVGRHCFTMAGILSFLERHKFKFQLNELTMFLKNDLGAEHHFSNFKGRGTNYWSVPEFTASVVDLDSPARWKNGEGPL